MHFKNYLILSTVHKQPVLKVIKGITMADLRHSVSNDWTPDKDERLYFFPGCSVPRFKLRKKFNITIKPEYATSAFLSPEHTKKSDFLFDKHEGLYMVPGKRFSDFFSFILGEDNHFVTKLRSLLMNYDDTLLVNSSFPYCDFDDALIHKTFYQWSMDQNYELYCWKQDTCVLYSLTPDSDIYKLKCNIYNQNAILKIINKDSLIIDETKYNELRLMAESDDRENIILMMELMANSDYKKSLVYLLLLLKEFAKVIREQKKEIKHVNFKALLNYLDISHNNLDIDIDIMTASLIKHSLFTRTNIQRITQLYPDTARHDGTYYRDGLVLKTDRNDELDCVDDELDELTEPNHDENDNELI